LIKKDVIQFSIDYGESFTIGLAITSCVVSIAIWHTWTADFWDDFEQRIIDSAM